MSTIDPQIIRSLILWIVPTYDSRTRSMVPPWATEYDNALSLTAWFESSVILDSLSTIKESESKYVAIHSPEFFRKVNQGRTTIEVIVEAISSSRPDVVTFHTRRKPKLRIYSSGVRWHNADFLDLLRASIDRAGITDEVDLSEPPRSVILSNYVVARRKIYVDFIERVLRPFIVTVDGSEDLSRRAWVDARYRRGKPLTLASRVSLSEHRRRTIGKDHDDSRTVGPSFYPLHAFLAERLWSAYLERRHGRFKILHI